jgi:hypothetical protein
MCTPAIAIGVSIIGGITSAIGAYQKGQADKAYYDYLAQVAEENVGRVKKEADVERTFATTADALQSQRQKESSQEVLGAQSATEAANGVGGGSVTGEDIYKSTVTKADLDQALIKYNASQRQWQNRTKEAGDIANLRAQAQGYKMAGANAETAGNWAAAGSLISSAGSVASTWSDAYSTPGKSSTGPGKSSTGKNKVPTNWEK